ncbi:hypothetical protein LTS18_000485, partial [Coniosporium uncinatum]
AKAIKNLIRINKEHYNGKVQVIVAGSVRAYNARALRQYTDAAWYHTSAITEATSETSDSAEIQRIKEELAEGGDKR